MPTFHPPYVNVFDRDDGLQESSSERNVNFFVGHEAFFLSNFFNVVWILLFEGFVFRSLRQNLLLKLVAAGCFIQMLSCLTSLHRYNVNDEYGLWAIVGVWTGNAAFCLLNLAVSKVFFLRRGNNARRYNRPWIITTTVFVLLTTFSSILSTIRWEKLPSHQRFALFRITIPVSVLYQTIAMIFCLVKIRNNEFALGVVGNGENPIPPNGTFVRLLSVLIAINVLGFGMLLLRMPFFTYPNTGWFYTTCVIFTKYAGRFQVVPQANRGGEEARLLNP